MKLGKEKVLGAGYEIWGVKQAKARDPEQVYRGRSRNALGTRLENNSE